MVYKVLKSASRSFQRNIWLYDHADVVRFSERIRETDWNEMFNIKDIDEMCNLFTNKVIEIAKDCIPSKRVTIRGNDKPWFNNQLRKEIRLRDKLRKKVIKYNRDSDINAYKKQRNKVNNLKRAAKEKFEKNLDNIILENASNPKTLEIDENVN